MKLEDAPANKPYHTLPSVVSVVDSRVNVGALLSQISSEGVNQLLTQLNWYMPLTNEKYRLLCRVQTTSLKADSSLADKKKILTLWKLHPDDL